MKKFLYDSMFPDYSKMGRRDSIAFLIYIAILGIMFSTSLSLVYIAAAFILLPVAYITVEILVMRHQRKTEETNI